MAGTIEGRVNYNWHIADDLLVRDGTPAKIRCEGLFGVDP
jgi:hypothetical protein